MYKILKKINNVLVGIFSAIAIISIVTIITMNLTGIYSIIIKRYNLAEVTGVSAEKLMVNFKGLITYLQNPFINKLQFQDFIMSVNGEVHFKEVKNIFLTLIMISVIFTAYVIVNIIKKGNIREGIKQIIEKLNYGANTLLVFFAAIITVYIIDFSKAFVVFHKIFFRNDYWIFNAETDPIINALPEDLFMIYGAIILLGIFVCSIIIKEVNRRSKRAIVVNTSNFIMKG